VRRYQPVQQMNNLADEPFGRQARALSREEANGLFRLYLPLLTFQGSGWLHRVRV
jgi:hypothetical protein